MTPTKWKYECQNSLTKKPTTRVANNYVNSAHHERELFGLLPTTIVTNTTQYSSIRIMKWQCNKLVWNKDACNMNRLQVATSFNRNILTLCSEYWALSIPVFLTKLKTLQRFIGHLSACIERSDDKFCHNRQICKDKLSHFDVLSTVGWNALDYKRGSKRWYLTAPPQALQSQPATPVSLYQRIWWIIT